MCVLILTHLFPVHLFSAPGKHEEIVSFLMYSGGRERMHWEQMGLWFKSFRVLKSRLEKVKKELFNPKSFRNFSTLPFEKWPD